MEVVEEAPPPPPPVLLVVEVVLGASSEDCGSPALDSVVDVGSVKPSNTGSVSTSERETPQPQQRSVIERGV